MSLLKKTTPEIDPSDIWADDKLGREKVAQKLTTIISTISQPFVISLSAPYGSGKTFFTKRWQETLKKDGYPTIYFNAWEADYSKDPLTSFVTILRDQIEEYKTSNDAKEFSSLVNSSAKFIAKRALPIAAKVGTRLILGNAVDEIEKEIDNGITNFAESIVKDTISSHTQEKELRDRFTQELEKLPNVLMENDRITKNQIIVFIDDLDRCKPSFTIEMLECVKHFFSIPNFIFILMVDDKALEQSIASVYSPEICCDGYLRKFIDWRSQLPEPSHLQYTQHLFEVFSLSELENIYCNEEQNHPICGGFALIYAFSYASVRYNRTLRQMSQSFITLNLILRSIEDKAPFAPLLAYLVVLKDASPTKFYRYCINAEIPSLEDTIQRSTEQSDLVSLDIDYLLKVATFKITEQFIEAFDDARRAIPNSFPRETTREGVIIAEKMSQRSNLVNEMHKNILGESRQSFTPRKSGTSAQERIYTYFQEIEGLISNND